MIIQIFRTAMIGALVGKLLGYFDLRCYPCHWCPVSLDTLLAGPAFRPYSLVGRDRKWVIWHSIFKIILALDPFGYDGLRNYPCHWCPVSLDTLLAGPAFRPYSLVGRDRKWVIRHSISKSLCEASSVVRRGLEVLTRLGWGRRNLRQLGS